MSRRETLLSGVKPESVVELAASPRVFVPLWPFLERFTVSPSGYKALMVLKRFGFRVKADFDVDVLPDRLARKVAYRLSSHGRVFLVRVEADPSGGGSRVVLEAEYSGPYERFSQPLLDHFTEQLASELEGLARSPDPPDGDPWSPRRLAWVILRGTPVESRTEIVAGKAEARMLLEKLAAISTGRSLLVRLYSDSTMECIRLYFKDGGLDDIYYESPKRREEGLRLEEKLPAILAGKTWNITALEVPRL